MRQINEATVYISNGDKALAEYYRIFVKQIKPLPLEPQFSDFYSTPAGQKIDELLFVARGAGLARYAIYKYLK